MLLRRWVIQACEFCGKPFEPQRKTQKFCHVSCGQAASNARKTKKGPLFEAPREFKQLNIRAAPDGYKVIIVSDLHIPFEHKAVLEVVERFWVDFKPDLEIYAGDIFDCYCCVPGTKVLTRDLRWVPVEALRVGDPIIGFDEEIKHGGVRKLRNAEVTGIITRPADVVEVVLSNGDVLQCTPDHKWLVATEAPSRDNHGWRPTASLIPSRRKEDGIRLPKFFEPWDTEDTYQAGWVGGFLDGLDGLRLQAAEKPKVVSVRPLGIQMVVSLETSTHTYFADGYGAHNCVSIFDQNPSRGFHFQDEIDTARAWLYKRAEANPSARRVLIEGNHEDRVRRWLWKKGPELSSLRSLTLEKLLGLEEMKIENLSYGSKVNICGFLSEHGYRSSQSRAFPPHTARLMAVDTGSSGVCGHDHRQGLYRWTDSRGDHSYISSGCLCRTDMEYAPFPNWQHGFTYGVVDRGVLYVDRKSVV